MAMWKPSRIALTAHSSTFRMRRRSGTSQAVPSGIGRSRPIDPLPRPVQDHHQSWGRPWFMIGIRGFVRLHGRLSFWRMNLARAQKSTESILALLNKERLIEQMIM